MEVLNQGRAKDKILQQYLREAAFLAATNCCEIKVKYVRSRDNDISDTLSRYHGSKEARRKWKKQLGNDSNWQREEIPLQLYNFNCDW